MYNALEVLEAQGLAWHTVVRGRKKYTPGAPAKLRTIVEQKRVFGRPQGGDGACSVALVAQLDVCAKTVESSWNAF